MKTFPCFLSVLLIQSIACADFNSDARGTTTANFLKLGVGARAMGMGEAYSAVADDATALYWNPAGLARIQSSEASLMHAPYLDSTYYDYGAFAHRFGNHALGVGFQYFSAGSISETDVNNASLGSFSPYDLAISFGCAYRLSESGYAVGVAGKYIQSRILEIATAGAVDFGLQSRPYWDRLRLAFVVSNLGSKMKFEQESDSLPLVLRYGSSMQLTDHWLASFDFVSPKDNAAYVALGTEYRWWVKEGFSLDGRLGYDSLTAGDINGMTGLSFGFGVGWQNLNFDYAFLPYGSLGLTQRISLAFRWGGEGETHQNIEKVSQ